MRSLTQSKHRNLAAGICGLIAISTLAISTSSCKLNQNTTPIATFTAQQMPIFGMWVWQPEWIGQESEQDKLIAFCQEHGINRLLIQIHLEPNWDREGIADLQYRQQLRRLLSKAAQVNIKIEALDGAPEMGNARNHAKVLAVVDAILEFNRTIPLNERFAGIHYDIEPYATPEWHSDQRAVIMQDYLELFKYIRAKLSREVTPIQLAASIPFWYDQLTTDDNSCVIVYRGERKNFHEHIQDLTDYVAIMSYRRTAVGENSITSLIDAEVGYAHHVGRFACAAMETIALPESPELSFCGMAPGSFWSVKAQIDEHMANKTGFGGVFVHDYKGFRRLLEGHTDPSKATAGIVQ